MSPAADTATSERQELVKLCSSSNWSKAIRVLDSLIARRASVTELCNRAFCYSQLELHKHVIKDCNKALELDATLIQAYILKGNALSALGRKGDALIVLEQGYANTANTLTDLKQLLELFELLACAKQNQAADIEVMNSPNGTLSDSGSITHLEPTLHVEEDDKTSQVHSKSDDPIEIDSQYVDVSSLSNSLCQAVVTRQNNFVGSNKIKSINLDLRLSRGIAKVNEGKYDNAVAIFSQLLKDNPKYSEALIGRGTAYAFQRKLNEAIADFTKVIQTDPSAGEAWKRRGQALAALGKLKEAVQDLNNAAEFDSCLYDIMHERGIINFKFKDYNAAVKDLSACVSHDNRNKSAYTYFGLALSALGKYNLAKEAHLKSIELDKNFLDGWVHLAQLYQILANWEEAFNCLQKALHVNARFSKAYHLRGLLYHGLGQHRWAIKDLSMGLSIESSNIECLYLRASCYHAIGEYCDAVKDYDAVLELELESVEKFVFQCMAFYQKEIALYTASKVSSEFCWFDIDRDIDPLFKEYWCKKLHPKYVCERVFRQPSLKESLNKGRIKKQEFVFSKQKAALLHSADLIGQKIQYNCPGFLPNKRQYRMAGLAAIEVAQRSVKAWKSFRNVNRNNKKTRTREKVCLPSQNKGGVSSVRSSSETSTSYDFVDDRSFLVNYFSWRDIYSVAVKWRQISEPCDPVLWLNKIGEEHDSKFGSHTAMLLGQAKVVRYYTFYQRTLSIAKSFMLEKKYVNNSDDKPINLSQDSTLEKIALASSCSDLHDIVGENFWLATCCKSSAFQGKQLEGTRITVEKVDTRGFDFGIRTPYTPSRWCDYDAEMTLAWEALCNSCCEAYSSNMKDPSMQENVKDSILRLTYYWYNFMPLSRGSASVGYVVLLGLFLAANMEVATSIPEGVQVDWEAILSPSLDGFLQSIKPWLYPTLKATVALKDFPDITSTFETTGSVIAALSSYDS